MEFKDFFYIHHKVHFLWHYAYVFIRFLLFFRSSSLTLYKTHIDRYREMYEFLCQEYPLKKIFTIQFQLISKCNKFACCSIEGKLIDKIYTESFFFE